MAEGVNVRITGKLKRFVEEQASPSGLYESASEYVRDLIRRDYQRQEKRKWSWLMDQLRPGSRSMPINPTLITKHSRPISSYPQNLHSVYGVNNIASGSNIS